MCEECRQHPRWKQIDTFLRPFREAACPPRRLIERLRRLPSEGKRPDPPIWKPIAWVVFLLLWILLQQKIPSSTRQGTIPSMAGLPRSVHRPVGPRPQHLPESFGLSRLNRLPVLPETKW
ncbi:MAG: hypothetical protein NZ742_07095 [Acidobacteria bacterium]|nr:hypothetical protein [Acidobacteriota bacterium]MDW7984602.1 hypothetical protein [Acidobacteriota bacterium]